MIPVKVKCRVWHRSTVANKEFETEVDQASFSDSTRSSNNAKFSAWCANFFPGADKVEFTSMHRR
jgi:hypothetical protein